MLTPGDAFCFIHPCSPFYLLFGFRRIVEIDLIHLVTFVTSIIVIVLAPQFILILMLAAQNTILDIGSNGIAAALRWKADLAEHAGMLVLLANDQAHLALLYREDRGGIAIAALHKIDQAVSQARLDLPDVLARAVTHQDRMPDDMQLDSIAHRNTCQSTRRGQVDERSNSRLSRLFNEELRINPPAARVKLDLTLLEKRQAVQIFSGNRIFRAIDQGLRIGIARLSVLPKLTVGFAQAIVRLGFSGEELQDVLIRQYGLLPLARLGLFNRQIRPLFFQSRFLFG